MSARLDSMEANQRTIMRNQDEQKRDLVKTQKTAFDDIGLQIKSTLKQFNETAAQGARIGISDPNTYDHKAAQPPRNNDKPPQPTPKYKTMARRVSETRPPTTLTNSALTRVYVKDWRSDPVEVVKKANDIEKWTNLKGVDEVSIKTAEVWPDLDAVRHVNQFGYPEQPMMEIACTPQKSDTVRIYSC